MTGKIIRIDEKLCNGCGICVTACHEGAIGMVDGKAKLLREDYCDGLGDCLPVCPTGAISFAEKPAAKPRPWAGSMPCATPAGGHGKQWPLQIKLVPENAPFFAQAHLLIAADCTAFAHESFHANYMKNKVTIIACPKLDAVDYTEKLTAILKGNDIKSVTVARMEVPCCGGLENAVKTALANCGKMIPWQTVTFSTDGRVLDK